MFAERMRAVNETIFLISHEYDEDEIGQQIETDTQREVFCDIKSIQQNEFFRAGQNGLKPEFVAEVHSFEYDGETEVLYNGEKYSVYRTYYRKSDDKTELYLTEKAGIK